MKAKIIHIDSERTWRGGQQQSAYLFEAMIGKKLDTLFVARSGSAIAEYLANRNLPCRTLPMRGEFDIYSAFRISRIARKHDYNLLHCHSSHSLSIGLIASLFYDKLKVIASRRVDFHIRQNIFNKYNHKNLAKIVCISDAIRQVLLSDGVDDKLLRVIRSGVKLDKYSNADPSQVEDKYGLQDKIVIGTVAAIEGHKDFPTLLEAARIIAEHKQNFRLVLVGDGSLKEEMMKLADSKGIIEYVVFTGYQEQVGDFLKAFDIFVLSSKKEGLGTSILDAMAVGLPIVASNVGGIPEAVSNNINGFLVDRQNPLMLAQSIIKLIDDEELRSKFADVSLELSRNFDINQTVARNIALYDEVLGIK